MRLPRFRKDIVCQRAVEMIADYLEDALPTRQRASLEHHLGRCPHCAEYLSQLKATITATGRLRANELSPEMRETLIELYRKTRQQR